MSKNTGGPAFPSSHKMTGFQDGMTLLDWFAGQALLSAPDFQRTSDPFTLTAEWAYQVGKEMLIQKEKIK